MSDNTQDKSTLRDFIDKIQEQYGKTKRVWVMDRGIPSEENLEWMRQSDPPMLNLVGTPKGRLTQLEKDLLELDWQRVRPKVRVKLLSQEKELYVPVESQDRVNQERAGRRRKLKAPWQRLKELRR